MSSQAPAGPEQAAPFAVEIITLMPHLWPEWLHPTSGLVGRAFDKGRATLTLGDLRAFGRGPHRQVDDAPFGGGAGMVLMAPPLHQAIAQARARTPGPVVLLAPRGRTLVQRDVERLAQGPGMTLVCGRYEGFDERAYAYVDETLSLGDFVLTAGDPAALCLVDSVVRLLPGVLGNPASITDESFTQGGLEYPQYTRPITYEGQSVPDVLRSGDHAAIARWRAQARRALTAACRPDLLTPRASPS